MSELRSPALPEPATPPVGSDRSDALRPLNPADRGWLRSVRPTRRAAVVVAVVAVATVALPVSVAVPLLALAVVAGVAAVDLWLAMSKQPSWHRSRPPVLVRGLPHPFEVELTPGADTGAGRVRVDRVRQPTPVELEVDPADVRAAHLVGTVTGLVRGIYAVPPAVARLTGPLGLAGCDRRGQAPCAVTVFPDLPRALRLADSRRRQRTADEGETRARLGLGTELEGIRDYSPDDDIRQVNWLATARVGRPLTNLYRVDENREVLLVVDAGRLMRSPIGTATRLDVALDALAVMAVAADKAGDRVGAVAFAEDIVRTVAARRHGAAVTVRALFDLHAREVESDYERAFQVVAGRKRSLVVLFSDLTDPAAARTILAAMPVLVRRHAVLLATSRDPDLAELLTRPPSSALEVLRASTAAELLAARSRSVAMLTAMGADVVEADPAALGPRLVRSYLRLKRMARL